MDTSKRNKTIHYAAVHPALSPVTPTTEARLEVPVRDEANLVCNGVAIGEGGRILLLHESQVQAPALDLARGTNTQTCQANGGRDEVYKVRHSFRCSLVAVRGGKREKKVVR